MDFQNQNYLLIFLPAIIGYGTQLRCSNDTNTGSTIKFRPPSWVFGLVWPILFLLLGLSWSTSMQVCTNKQICMFTYGLTSILLGLWLVVYDCMNSKKEASWVLLLAIASSLASFAQGNEISKLMISPLIAWIIFAMVMNTTEVQSEKLI
tara:strand:- start:17057 stop:17506 length:450 start_codon:yes stop_codon:yes gene_type:complete